MNGWRLRLTARSAALLGGVAGAPIGVHAATALLGGESDKPLLLLPGTSLRGVLRDAFRRFATAKGSPCSGSVGCSCPTCDLFGRPDGAGALWVRSSVAQGSRHLAVGVSIERSRRTAARAEGTLWVEERGVADFEARVTASRPLTAEERTLLDDFWSWIEAVGLSVGRRKSAGVGRFDVQVLPAFPDRSSVSTPPTRDDEVVGRYLLRLTLLEPTRLVGHRQRDFYRDSLQLIPTSTLRGALGWALERLQASTALADLFVERPVLLTPAFPVGPEDGSIPPWLIRYRCSGDPPHLVDGALARVADSLSRPGAPRLERCPRCGSELREHETAGPKTMVMGHVTLDPERRRARRGDLHHQVALAPGNVVACELLARPSQVETLRNVDELLIGGRRARGMGLARFEVDELPPLPPVRDRIDATGRRLAEAYGVRDERIAVLGLLTDAATERPLAEILEEAGLEVVTGEVRDVIRGGWDEQRSCMRPLRRLLAAGSWIAVRLVTNDALEALEHWELEGIPDREGVAPLLLRVRDDWIDDDWEAIEMKAEEAPTETAGDLDQLVRDARRLCEEARQLPDRAALQTLLRFARATPSVEETVLFIEYQASRDQHRGCADFLGSLGTFIKERFPANPEATRRFLGLIVRAGYVEGERRKANRDGRRSRQGGRPQGGRYGHR